MLNYHKQYYIPPCVHIRVYLPRSCISKRVHNKGDTDKWLIFHY